LEQGQKEVSGVVYTPRWSEPVWVEANSLSVLFAYCLPGEFADSGQEILGDSELEVLESYSLAITSNLTGWLIVVENVDENVRFPAAVGIICASDVNDPETRVVSPDEQQVLNNIIQEFNAMQAKQITTINQLIDIINKVTTPDTGGPVTRPPPPDVEIDSSDTEGDTSTFFEFNADVTGGTWPFTYSWDFDDDSEESTAQNPVHTFDIAGEYNVAVTVRDSKGQTASDKLVIRVTGTELAITNDEITTNPPPDGGPTTNPPPDGGPTTNPPPDGGPTTGGT